MSIPEQVLQDLRSLDTPTVCNALELVIPERRGYGYTVEPLVCARPELPPMVGYARTAIIRAQHPVRDSISSDDYYSYIAEGGPTPSIVVIQDLDNGYGAWWGEVNTNIHRGLGCLGVVTDGSIRDLPDVADDFQLLADRIGPSHAHVRAIGIKTSVTVAGMQVNHGDLIHADQHGAVVIPADVADKVKAAADTIAARESVVIKASQKAGFNMDRLRAAWKGMAEIH